MSEGTNLFLVKWIDKLKTDFMFKSNKGYLHDNLEHLFQLIASVKRKLQEKNKTTTTTLQMGYFNIIYKWTVKFSGDKRDGTGVNF